MRRFYRVLLPLFLLALWLLLNESLSAGQVALGAVLALWFTWAASRLRPLHARPQRLWLAFGLAAKVTLDIMRSNLAVAKLILQRGPSNFKSGFIHVPLTMRDPHGLAMLACILTYTPGTVWVDLSADNQLTLHVLDLENEQEWVTLIQERYERPLMEMFE